MIEKLTFSQLSDKIMRRIFYALAFFLPISSAMCELFFGLLILTYIVKRTALLKTNQNGWIKSFCPSLGFLSKPVAIFTIVCLISVIFSPLFIRSLSGYFFELLQNVLYACFFVECFNRKKHFQIFITLFLISGLVVCINGIWQYYHHSGFILGREITEKRRILSSLKHTNDFGAYLLFLIGILQAFVLLPKIIYIRVRKIVEMFYLSNVWMKIFLSALLLLALVCLGLTYSRGAWISYIVVVLSLLVLSFNKRSVFLLVLLGVFFALFIPRMAEERNVTFVTDNYSQTQRQVKNAEISGTSVKSLSRFGGSGRSTMWKEAFTIIKRRPILGFGWNTYTEIAQNQKFPHNSYLRLTGETGVVGLLSFFYVLLILIWTIFKNVRQIQDPYYRYLLIGGSSALFGFLAHSLVDTHFYSIQLATLMWVTVGMLVTLIELKGQNS